MAQEHNAQSTIDLSGSSGDTLGAQLHVLALPFKYLPAKIVDAFAMTRWLMAFGLALAAGLGCGAIGSGSGTTSCDTNQNGMHSCGDITWSGPIAAPTCNSPSTMVASCSHSGTMGGCKAPTLSVGLYTETVTSWTYPGTANDMANCTKGGGTWINP